jgi:hypothetical protein
MKKWNKLFKLKNGQLYWKESRGRQAAGGLAGTDHGDGYRTVRIAGKAVYAHRIVKEMTTGKKANGQVDHKDRNRSNNKPKNLRTVSRSTNNKNRKSWQRKK